MEAAAPTAAACTKALDALLDLHLSNDELVQVASLGEKAVAGTAHADNVAASLLREFVIVYDKPIRTISLKPPTNLAVVVATPQLPVQADKTRKARKIIPEQIRVKNSVLNLGRPPPWQRLLLKARPYVLFNLMVKQPMRTTYAA